MKATAERLAESFCRPQTEEECILLGFTKDAIGYLVLIGPNGKPMLTDPIGYISHTEISVPHFTDLIHDSIEPWRLEEDGFVKINLPTCTAYEFTKDNGVVIQVASGGDVSIIEKGNVKTDHILMQGIKTYSQIITQSEFIG
jgi:hypothetical protein